MRKHFLSFLVIMLAAGMLAPTVLAQGAIFSGIVVDEDGNPLPGARMCACAARRSKSHARRSGVPPCSAHTRRKS